MKNIKYLLIIICHLPLLSVFAKPFQSVSGSKIIAIGSSFNEIISTGDSPQIFNNEVLKAKASGSIVKFTGIKIGESEIKINGRLEKIQVVSPRIPKYLKELENLCRKTLGISCDVTNGYFTVNGSFYRLQDYLEFQKKIITIDESLLYQLKISDQNNFHRSLERHLNTELSRAGLIPQKIIMSPYAQIKINSKNSFKEQYKSILQKYGVRISLAESSLNLKPTLNVKITIAEVRKSAALKYGISWPDAFHASLLPSGVLENGTSGFSLNTLSADGAAKILAQPNIICRSGEEAEFLAGGEVPIKIINYKYQQIQWKKYGIQLNVKPKTDESGRISLSIVTEISTIDPARKAEDVPGFLTNKVTSHFDLNHSQTIAISGLIKNEESENHAGLPGIKNLPILGSLFSSQEFMNNQTELIVFVTPTIMDIL